MMITKVEGNLNFIQILSLTKSDRTFFLTMSDFVRLYCQALQFGLFFDEMAFFN